MVPESQTLLLAPSAVMTVRRSMVTCWIWPIMFVMILMSFENLAFLAMSILKNELFVTIWAILVIILAVTGDADGDVDTVCDGVVDDRAWERKGKEMFLFNDALNTFYLRLYGVRHMVKHHSDSERGNPLPPYGLLFPIDSKCSFICTIPQTG